MNVKHLQTLQQVTDFLHSSGALEWEWGTPRRCPCSAPFVETSHASPQTPATQTGDAVVDNSDMNPDMKPRRATGTSLRGTANIDLWYVVV